MFHSALTLLDQFGHLFFAGSALVSFDIPRHLVTIGGGLFDECLLTDGEGLCWEYSSFVVVSCVLLSEAGGVVHGAVGQLSDVFIHDCAIELLLFVREVSSNHEYVGAFLQTNIGSVAIPDSVVERYRLRFHWRRSLRCVPFGASSKLERIGKAAVSRHTMHRGRTRTENRLIGR